MTIGKRLKQARQKLDFNQSEMSNHLNISQSAYSKLEKDGSQPSADTFEMIAKLGINTNWLLTGQGNMTISNNLESNETEKIGLIKKMLSAAGVSISDLSDEALKRQPNFVLGTKDEQGNKKVIFDAREKYEELEEKINLILSKLNSEKQ
jgi:transcriptional regulator with XRE-family HTH domain